MSIAEKLREAAARKVICSQVDRFALALTGNPGSCNGSCKECVEKWYKNLADAIEAEQSASKPAQLPEGVEWPRYESGELVKFGDKFVDVHGCEAKAKMVIFGAEGFVFNAGYSPKFCRGYGTPVKRPEPELPDTQEAIDSDAAKSPCLYFGAAGANKCEECPRGKADDDTDYSLCRADMMRDLLRRQRKLMEAGR